MARDGGELPTARKWLITPVINGISRVHPLIIGVISHLLSGMSHQVGDVAIFGVAKGGRPLKLCRMD